MYSPTDPEVRASLLYAGIEIARECASSGRTPDEALAHIRQGESGRNSFDYAGAFEVAGEHEWAVFSPDPDVETAFRDSLSRLIELARPFWVRVLPAGRQRVVPVLGDDLLQCMEIGGLLGHEPEVVAWWDRLAAIGRQWDEEARMAIGRAAEEQTMAYERKLLDGTGKQPRWVAIEDNGAGYDVQSWRSALADAAVFEAHFIEVKGSSETGIIHLSRGEWNFAVANGSKWEIQIWLSSASTPAILKIGEVQPHIPDNHGDGRWVEVQIPTDRLLPAASDSG